MSDIFQGIVNGLGLGWNIGTNIWDRAHGQDSATLAKKNMDLQKNISSENLKLAKDQEAWQKSVDQRNFDFAAQQTQIQRQREDTAHQREVADLRAAGLSPLANLQGSATGNVVSQAAGVSPVVPQQDGTGIANAAATAIQNKTAMAGLRQDMFKELLKTSSDLYRQRVEHKFKSSENALDRSLDVKKFTSQLDFQNDELAQQKEIAMAGIARDYQKMTDEMLRFSQDLNYRETKDQLELLSKEWNISNYKSVSSKDQEASERETWFREAKEIAEALNELLVVWSKGDSESSSTSSGVQGGASASVSQNGFVQGENLNGTDNRTTTTSRKNGKVTSIMNGLTGVVKEVVKSAIPDISGSLNFGHNSSESSSTSKNESRDATRLFQQAMRNYNAIKPFPVYRGSR